MINLFENYNQESWDLHYSLIVSGYDNVTISLTDDGFLPHDVTSPIKFFTQFESGSRRPLYFNEINIPKYWEIIANNSYGEIYEYDKKKAHINFVTPTSKRFIKTVDWLDDGGSVLTTDHYNIFGKCFAKTFYNDNNEKYITSYYNNNNKEVLTQNYVTGHFVVNYMDKIYFFKNKTEFILFYLKLAGYNLDRILFNSLYHPYFIHEHLDVYGRDILFWQEEVEEDLPGNMKELLNRNSERSIQIVVQDKEVFKKIIKMVSEEDRKLITYLGYLYPFKKENRHQKNVLILTNSDEIEYLHEIVSSLENLTFHIGAITEMSSKLLSMGDYENVRLYPNITTQITKKLYEQSDFYLDINQGNEILDATREAFENQLLLIGFKETIHAKRYIAHTFSVNEPQKLIDFMQQVSNDKKLMNRALKLQKEYANTTSKNTYIKLIEG